MYNNKKIFKSNNNISWFINKGKRNLREKKKEKKEKIKPDVDALMSNIYVSLKQNHEITFDRKMKFILNYDLKMIIT